MKKILVLGAGAMGSAFTVPCLDNQNFVSLVGTHLEDKFIDQMMQNDNFHPILNCKLPNKLKLRKFEKFAEEFKEKPDLIVLGVNSKGIDWAGNEIAKYYSPEIPILLLTKGLTIINNQYETIAEKLKQILKKNGSKKISISAVGGPCLASGLANKVRSSVVLANQNIETVKYIGKMISTNYYSTEFSDDLIGVEVCAAVKNIYSMVIGASKGLCSLSASEEIKKKNYLNTAASLMYQSVSEMVHFTEFLKGKEETVYGLSGLGDLYVSSAGGRNSKMGEYLGEGYNYLTAKKKFMPNDTIEGAELALEVGPKILKEFEKDKFPLMIGLIESICNNKKLEINWK
ncbi:MAG: glycerol-3-phosphate dehydrogenase [Candidatus Pelagibacter sp.]|jgi:glycerol-3-phosphate dehydrogenase (NAD(P)+)|nr:glycerol-3-phosphate dehydrogenase [Candidatus Pelagibacter sp.]MDP6784381.1 glycerol-3-phosphate dehydrogenase [Alphaproteobacteria bacterium]|tara:strand:+ start:7694 stop:8725 length:1032 start_codon:yes stop_codon:yes gene_type:complete